MWAIVTVPERESLADRLLATLREPAIKVLDRERDLQRNHVRAWREVVEHFQGDWVGVLQDDAILCDDFDAKVSRRLREAEALGYQAISLYSRANSDLYLRAETPRWGQIDLHRVPGIVRKESGFRPLPSALPGEQCVLVKRQIAARYPAFAAENPDLFTGYPGVHDGIFGLFLNLAINAHLPREDAARTNRVYIALPNLVGHDTTVESTFGPGGNDPVAYSSSSFRFDAD